MSMAIKKIINKFKAFFNEKRRRITIIVACLILLLIAMSIFVALLFPVVEIPLDTRSGSGAPSYSTVD